MGANSSPRKDAIALAVITDLIYDVGMNNGDDTAYYLRRGFRVVAIEANPILAETASRRFEREIAEGSLIILSVGISDQDSALPFWICDTHPEWSSFDKSIASRDNADHHQITISCCTFKSIVQEFGTPYYLKLDIEGSEIQCLRDLAAFSDLPKYVSFEKTEHWMDSVNIMRDLDYTGFKLISQFNYLPVEYPPTRAQIEYERAQKILNSRNPFLRVFRNIGARNLLKQQIDRPRSRNGWTFPAGSSGPFGEDLLMGKWQTFEEIIKTLTRANHIWEAGKRSIFWDSRDYSFWADFHARRP
jgi:FkbM family methyltransferase